jgi:hypothetical protein
MGSFSNYMELELLDHVFKVGAYTAATNLYVALLKSTPDDADTGSTLPGEVSGGAYARKGCNTWAAAASGATSNSIAIEFVQATADWGVVTHFAVVDHSSTGNVIGWGALTVTKNIQSGDQARFATNDLDVTLD